MTHLRSITLKVELSPGIDIRNACCDLCELANRIGCMVEAKLNGVLLWAVVGDNPLKLAEAWEREMSSGKAHKIAKCW
jgi:hypothetical protein